MDLPIRLHELDTRSDEYATRFVDVLLAAGRTSGASDLHLLPQRDGLSIHWRVDGVLQPIGVFPRPAASNVVARLKVLAELLTYRTDIPQEGRIRDTTADGKGPPTAQSDMLEMRVSTFPTLHGEKAVVRIFAGGGAYSRLDELGLPDELYQRLSRLLTETSGALLVTGPAGSGKTTSVYACLRQLVAQQAGRNIVSLEDPIEVAVPGVAQSQINPSAGFDLAGGLKFLLRQDPEVIMVGEIRDPSTARTAFQGALTGHLVLSTFHAGSAAEAISRLSDMGIEPYLLRSGLLAILCQRLVRRLCRCALESRDPSSKLGLPVARAWQPVGCDNCGGTGYRGRALLAEMLAPDASDVGRAILSRDDSARLEELAIQAGMVNRWRRARDAVEAGVTSPAEIRRVMGFSDARGTEHEKEE